MRAEVAAALARLERDHTGHALAGDCRLCADLALVRQEIARLEAEVARLRPLAAPVWPESPTHREFVDAMQRIYPTLIAEGWIPPERPEP